ncbi:hypothetical protein G210_2611 [Candida maltosa Xu316]|uniref:Uncharacterized protein n=1 Tax=Candida maltosa (strain Xu316) TaxID=1245528 RepID=M3IL85_CANMX|nr:hypothetical protein G210_2611 [Candida maltosa Xu316]
MSDQYPNNNNNNHNNNNNNQYPYPPQQQQQMNQHQLPQQVQIMYNNQVQQNNYQVMNNHQQVVPPTNYQQQHPQFIIPNGVPQQQNYTLPPPQSIITNIKDIPSKPRQQQHQNTTLQQTPKKKRGRPPKPNSFAQKITTTLNINVNTSPLHSSPAESNSNLSVKQGAPDIFTPLMRVSPSSAKKKKRKSSSSGSMNGSPTSIKKLKSSTSKPTKQQHNNNPLVTPLSSSVENNFPNSDPPYQINYKTLDNISMITQSQSFYNTPPPTSRNRFFSTPNSQNYGLDKLSSPNFPAPIDHHPIKDINNYSSPNLGKINESKHEALSFSPSKNLLPPVSLSSNTNNTSNIKSNKDASSPPTTTATTTTATTTTTEEENKDNSSIRKSSTATTTRKSSEDFSFKLTIDDSGKAVLSSDIFAPTTTVKKQDEDSTSPTTQPPALLHTKSAIGLDSLNKETNKVPLRRHNSDITNFASVSKEYTIPSLSSISEVPPQQQQQQQQQQQPFNPQTPKETYTYVSTGLTPLFNLTPQFNALMYSVMNINNSPPYKRGMNPFVSNQELFNERTTVENNNNQLEELTEVPKLEDASQSSGSGSGSGSTSEESFSGDARLALKKMIHIKRK